MPTQTQRSEQMLRLAAQVLINRTKAGTFRILQNGFELVTVRDLATASKAVRIARTPQKTGC